ncbi:hypothetical protein BJI69_18865 [Luteibacter rhizovicinus DSM 16549]|uniref:SnoaL-like domain-containing protein n=1 Tax=Luteibacter rhizovicinus DSM 16549 TaxID=1440763 RepID=A0A1L3EXG6_9GAMM|nr:nuclear transport factor 2 family protein [Luteibacter rhizovicinus]APG05759.1 hypothetical protein BJI69_18865 [Luteibacter rhizovicinus DSM 16549]
MKRLALGVTLSVALGAGLTFGLSATAAPVEATARPGGLGQHASTAADLAAIAAVLDRYTQCVTAGDEAGFRALLLDDDIPFSAIPPGRSVKAMTTANLSRYAGFRDAVFRSGQRFQQSFHHVRIAQDGPLAQASLDFVTRSGDGGSTGWKTLQLVKTAGGWKIASEFFTVRSLR